VGNNSTAGVVLPHMRFAVPVLLVTSLAAFAQAPAFEVASIRPGERGQESIETGPASLTMRHVRLLACIRWAYDVQEYQIVGPDWMNDLWFDVFAKSAGEATTAQLHTMLQGLLADRFKLAVRRDTKEMTTLILTVAKGGHKLEPTETEGSPAFQTGQLTATGRGATLEPLLNLLSRELRTPVVDETGLKGKFNYFLDINPYFTEESRKAAQGINGPPPDANAIIAAAFQKELGLKVEPKKAPVPMIIVDHVEKAPSEN
jgi:uncharacterized protein (TIGR03435 family)